MQSSYYGKIKNVELLKPVYQANSLIETHAVLKRFAAEMIHHYCKIKVCLAF